MLMILYSVSIIRFVFSVKVKKRKSGCMLIAVVIIMKRFGYYTEGSYIITYYISALKHSKVSNEKLE
jgi:hypothetical protein